MKKSWEEYKGKFSLKKFLLIERGHRCEKCQLELWLNIKIPIEIHHIDGNKHNNTKDNLQLLCPNCHSMTDNFRGRNIKKDKQPPKKKKCLDCLLLCSLRSDRCKSCAALEKAKAFTKRPSDEQLKQDIIEFKNNKCAISRKYGVSDNAINKWIKKLK